MQSKVKELEKELSHKKVARERQQPVQPVLLVKDLSSSGSVLSPTLELVKIFFHHVYPFMPIFHMKTFLDDWNSQELTVLYAMCALACKYTQNSKAEEYYRLCKLTLSDKMGIPSISGVQTLLLLTVYGSFCVNNGEPWLFAGSAFRMVNMLRLNERPPKDLPIIEKEIRSRLWWHCYLYGIF